MTNTGDTKPRAPRMNDNIAPITTPDSDGITDPRRGGPIPNGPYTITLNIRIITRQDDLEYGGIGSVCRRTNKRGAGRMEKDCWKSQEAGGRR